MRIALHEMTISWNKTSSAPIFTVSSSQADKEFSFIIPSDTAADEWRHAIELAVARQRSQLSKSEDNA